MKRWFWLPWFIAVLVYVGVQRVSAVVFVTTTKESLNFEINAIQVTNHVMSISGWAYINTAQNYRSTTDHQVWIELLSASDQKIIEAQVVPLSMTSIASKVGYSTCSDTTYFSTTCNYIYDYVGFTVSIDLLQLKPGESYTTSILVSALRANAHRKTPLYYPIQNPISTKLGDYVYSAISALNDTSLRISDNPVYARKEPSKTSTIWALGTSCSTSYSNRLYFKYGAVFNKILNRFPIDSQTYYAMSGQLDACIDGRRRIIEGTTVSPVWISSLFVEYTGSPLTISSVLINSAPTITASDQSVHQGDLLNLLTLATAHDAEEGDLSHNITLESSNYQDLPGVYTVSYRVLDKYSYVATKTITITVKEPLNSPPYITASNRSVLQFTTFDPFKDVFANDLEEGNITDRIRSTGEVNTSILGDYWVCYTVLDNKGLSHEKCITVTVYSYWDSNAQYRSISLNKPFYMEPVSTKWKYRLALFNQIKQNTTSIARGIISKKPQ